MNTRRALLALTLALTFAGCCPAPEPRDEAPFCWATGQTTGEPRLRCWPTLAECTEDAYRWGGGVWACEGWE